MIRKREEISAVITFVEKDKKYLKNCLQSLEKSAQYAGINLRHFLVANGTKVDNKLKLNFPGKIILSKTNIGFGQAINLGMKKAATEWGLILAPDTRCQRTTLHKLISQRTESTAIIGPKILVDNEAFDFSILPLTDLWTIILEQSYLYKIFPALFRHPFADKGMYKKRRKVAALASTFWLINLKKYFEVGGFDKRFFLFHDDTDLCKRIAATGYKIIYYPQAKIFHYGHRSTGGEISAKLHFDSYKIYLSKYYSPIYVFICLTVIVLGSISRFLFWKIIFIFIQGKIVKEKIKSKIKYHRKIIDSYRMNISYAS